MTGSANEGDQTEQGHPGRASAPTIEGLVARLEAMAAQLEEQRAEIARLQTERPAPPAVRASESRRRTLGETRTTDRRGLLRGLLAAGAAVTGLWAGGARAAHADARGTLVGGSSVLWGLVATPGGRDPLTVPPILGFTAHGVIGTLSSSAPSPRFSSGVLGLVNEGDGVGVQGLSNANYGVYGESGGTHGVLAKTLGSFTNVSGVLGTAALGATNGVIGENTSTFDTATGVFGVASGGAGATVGVWGRTTSDSPGAIGALGEATAAFGAI